MKDLERNLQKFLPLEPGRVPVFSAFSHGDSLEEENEVLFDRKIGRLLFTCLGAEFAAFDQRDKEVYGGKTNIQRVENLYYPAVQELARLQDRMFSKYLSQDFRGVLTQFRYHQFGWQLAPEFANRIQDQLSIGTPEKGGIVDSRAKSMFSVWYKMRDRDLDPDEVFDRFGVRITCKSKESARRMADSLIEQNQLMKPWTFRHRNGEQHEPFQDTLDTPKANGFASIRMNFFDPKFGVIFEVQIQPLDLYIGWRIHEKRMFASMGASPKYGCLVGPE